MAQSTDYLDKLEGRLAHYRGEMRRLERDHSRLRFVPLGYPLALVAGLIWGPVTLVAALISVSTLWGMGHYFIRFRREDFQGEIRSTEERIAKERASVTPLSARDG